MHEPSKQDNMEAMSELIETMMADPDPKFQESEFLSFLKKVRTGEFEISENQLIEHPEKAGQEFPSTITVDGDKLAEYRRQAEEFIKKMNEESPFEDQIKAELEAQETEPAFDKYFATSSDLESTFSPAERGFETTTETTKEASANPIEDMWRKLYENYDENDPQLEDKLKKIWAESVKNYEALADPEKMNEHWQTAHAMQDFQYLNFSSEYKYQENNPYHEHPQPLELLKEKLTAGDNRQVALVLEAHLQKHPEDARAWRTLGMTFQDLDQDRLSVSCFLNALKNAPNDSATYLQLGVSCTNMFDEIHAMSFLEKWLQTSPVYSGLITQTGQPPVLVSEERLTADNWELPEIEAINQKMIEKFAAIESIAGTANAELSLAIGVLHFMAQDFERALGHFRRAVDLDPNNYSYWNKLGATFAQLRKPADAVECYHKALDLKPNYVRGWANLAINYNSQLHYTEAASFFLNALSLNPKATHLWSYLESCYICLNDVDSISKTPTMDLTAFADAHNVHGPAELPQPEGIGYIASFESAILKSPLDEWIASFSINNVESHAIQPNESVGQ